MFLSRQPLVQGPAFPRGRGVLSQAAHHELERRSKAFVQRFAELFVDGFMNFPKSLGIVSE